MIRSVVVLGGGSAGLLAALSLKARLPALAVRIVYSREIGIIGVGEGSTADLPNQLHGFLGIEHLFIDASGFRSELLGQALGEKFQSFDDALFCDRAVAGGWERTTEPLLPYTTAETMDAGWGWQIEHEHHVNRGYVYSSAFLSDDQAEVDFRSKNPRVQNTRLVRFRSGYYPRSWTGNVVAIGNSAGFVEPLEATALYVIATASRALAFARADCGGDPTPTLRDTYNRIVTRIWHEIRDFLAIHYRFNTRLDTPFWRHCREATQLHGAERIVRYYEENGPSDTFAGELLTPETSIFHLEGFYALLLGQKVPHRRVRPLTDVENQIIKTMRETRASEARHGFGVAESLALVRSPHWQWSPSFYQC